MDGNAHHRDLLLSLIFAAGILLSAFVLSVFHAPGVEAADAPTSVLIRVCGNGVVEPGEVCDQGSANNTGAYASSTGARHCLPDCSGYGPYCGDGILQVRFAEQCDDGNNVGGDLCSATCQSEPPSPPAINGTPTVGSTPNVPGATPGSIPSEIPTKVVLRGKAFPGGAIKVLLDGQPLGVVQADANADFLYTTTNITPGTATFSFQATDQAGVNTITNSFVFDVLQSAVTTVANIFLPPTVSLSKDQVKPGELLTLSGYSVPTAKVATQVSAGGGADLVSTAAGSGAWALQMDTASLSAGYHAAKASFQLSDTIKSGWGKSVNFYIGTGAPPGVSSTDVNGDGKVNLVDFSIFLTDWNTSNPRSDFNQDGKVNLADFSILLFNWTG